MKYLENEGDRIVISVGGSLIVPDEIDTGWLGEFTQTINRYVERGYKFAIVVGGGKTARKYQEAARNFCPDKEEADWLGIYGTRLNAYLLKTILGADRVIENPEEADFTEDVLIVSGWKPGFSTDYVAVLLSRNLGIKRLINLTNVDYVYDKDPKYTDAKKIEEISWEAFRKIVGDEWDPGMNTPFDPVASRKAEELGLEVAVINGNGLENFERYLDGKGFKGTLIRPLSRALNG